MDVFTSYSWAMLYFLLFDFSVKRPAQDDAAQATPNVIVVSQFERQTVVIPLAIEIPRDSKGYILWDVFFRRCDEKRELADSLPVKKGLTKRSELPSGILQKMSRHRLRSDQSVVKWSFFYALNQTSLYGYGFQKEHGYGYNGFDRYTSYWGVWNHKTGQQRLFHPAPFSRPLEERTDYFFIE